MTNKQKLKELIEAYADALANAIDPGTAIIPQSEWDKAEAEARKALFDFIDTLDLSTMGDP